MSRRRDDGTWRREGFAKRGSYCRRCKRSDGLQADHLRPRSQGGKSVVENLLVLCRGCHQLKTEHMLLVEEGWLDPDQIEWLRETGWVWWEEDGETYGEGRKSFAKRSVQ